MKVPSLLLSILLLLSVQGRSEDKQSIDSSESARTVTVAMTGEDATSAFYYFFYTPANG